MSLRPIFLFFLLFYPKNKYGIWSARKQKKTIKKLFSLKIQYFYNLEVKYKNTIRQEECRYL